MKPEDLKGIVKEKYGKIAKQDSFLTKQSCCEKKSYNEVDYTIFSDDYTKLTGYVPEADFGLGCGIPTEHAEIKKGDHILDLGSGAGNDCFVVRSIAGETGYITGLDFTDEMIAKANSNLEKTGFKNIEFVKGDIENMPLPDANFNVVLSNCVLNLVPDKEKAYAEIFRVLKPGGHFCISDVVLKGKLPKELKEQAEMYAGCVAGAIQKEEYVKIIAEQGFTVIDVKSEVKRTLPDVVLVEYLSEKQIAAFKNGEYGIFSLTVTGRKPY